MVAEGYQGSFCQLQCTVQKAVNKAKEEWIQKVASDAEAAVKDGRVIWNYIHRLQQVYGGHRSVRPTAVFKDNGELTKGPSEVSDHWFQCFKKVLNVCIRMMQMCWMHCLLYHLCYILMTLLLWLSLRMLWVG